MSLNLTTWHHRGGLAGYGQPQVIMTVDPDTLEQTPVIVGTDAGGNTVLLDPSSVAPWQAGLVSQIVNTAGGIFGSTRYASPYGQGPGGATITTAATPGGVGAGLNLSTNTLIIIAAVAAFFLLGKGRR